MDGWMGWDGWDGWDGMDGMYEWMDGWMDVRWKEECEMEGGM